jgi:hypothetical protein
MANRTYPGEPKARTKAVGRRRLKKFYKETGDIFDKLWAKSQAAKIGSSLASDPAALRAMRDKKAKKVRKRKTSIY